MRNEFTEPEIKKSILTMFDVRTKIVFLFCLAMMGIFLEHWQALIVGYIFVWMMVIVSRVSLSKVKALLILNILTIWGIMWVQALFYDAYPKTPLFYLLPPRMVDPSTWIIGGLWEGIAFYYEGFRHGITQSLRMITPMTFGLLVFWTEDPVNILTGLNKMKLPYPIAFMIMTCLRFIPITFSEVKVTINSQRLRKYKPFDMKGVIFLYGIYNAIIRTMVPLLANCIRKSCNMAVSADSRGFTTSGERTSLRNLQMKFSDFAVIFIMTMMLGAVIGLKGVMFLSEAGIYHDGDLMPVYWFVGKYL